MKTSFDNPTEREDVYIKMLLVLGSPVHNLDGSYQVRFFEQLHALGYESGEGTTFWAQFVRWREERHDCNGIPC